MRFICQEGHSEVRTPRHAAAKSELRAGTTGMPEYPHAFASAGAVSLSQVAPRPEGCLRPRQ